MWPGLGQLFSTLVWNGFGRGCVFKGLEAVFLGCPLGLVRAGLVSPSARSGQGFVLQGRLSVLREESGLLVALVVGRRSRVVVVRSSGPRGK